MVAVDPRDPDVLTDLQGPDNRYVFLELMAIKLDLVNAIYLVPYFYCVVLLFADCLYMCAFYHSPYSGATDYQDFCIAFRPATDSRDF